MYILYKILVKIDSNYLLYIAHVPMKKPKDFKNLLCVTAAECWFKAKSFDVFQIDLYFHTNFNLLI